MRVLAKVAASFEHPKDARVTFEFKAKDLLVLMDAPNWIADTLMYKWMLKDGTLEVVGKTAAQKALEVDPMQGAKADGKKVDDDVVSDSVETEIKTTKRGRKAKEDV